MSPARGETLRLALSFEEAAIQVERTIISHPPHRPVSPVRELERTPADIPASMPVSSGTTLTGRASPAPTMPRPLRTPGAIASIAVVGAGRLGRALAGALREAGRSVEGPLGRGESSSCRVVLLCVADSEISTAARPFAERGALIGHTSGATPLATLGEGECFGLHPLQTFTERGGCFAGSSCAIAANSPRALAVAQSLADALKMSAFEIDDAQRTLYHSAASIASNFLLALEAAAEAVAESAGIERSAARRMFAPLVETTVRNWVDLGPQAALSGPLARGDDGTVDQQRRAVARVRPELLPLWDVLVERTRALAGGASS